MADDECPGVADLLPEGAVPLASVRCVVFLDQDGDQAYNWDWSTSAELLTLLGLIRLTEAELIARTDAIGSDG